MRIDVLGKRWRLRFAPNLKNRGDCDDPSISNKEIRISSSLVGEEKLEVLVHELVHASNWHLDEKFVAQLAEDLARILWRLGYRQHGGR